MKLNFLKGGIVSAAIILMCGFTTNISAQTQGSIYKPASTNEGRSILDPNSTGNVFDDGIPFYGLPELQNEPLGDPRTGASGGHTDLIAGDDGSPAAFMFYDSEKEAVLFRVRLAGQSTASKGYSFLFNTSFETFGPKAENFTQTNPGFQFEVVLETGTGVTIYELNENGATNSKTLSGGENPYFQKAFSDITAEGEVGYFYDFYVPLSELNGLLSPADGFRAVATTVTRAQSGITGTTSDVAGVDDDLYRDRNKAFVDYIESMPETTLNDISGADGDGFGNLVSAVPTTGVPTEAETSLSGTSVEADGTTITVRIYNEDDQEIANETTSVNGNSWSLSGLDPFEAGQYVTAEANAVGKDTSGESNPVFVRSVSDLSQCTDPPVIAVRSGNTFDVTVANMPLGLTLSNLENDLVIRLYNEDGTIYATTDDANVGYQQGSFSVNEDVSGYDFTLEFVGTGGGSFFNQPGLQVSAQYLDECESQIVATGTAGTFISETPVISPAQINKGDTSVSGTSNAGAEITVFVNGVEIGTATAGENGEWTLSGLESSVFSDGDEVVAQALDPEDGALPSANSNVVIVGTQQTLPPVTSGDYLNGDTVIEGSSIEGGSVEIEIFINSNFAGLTSTDAFGSWEFTLSESLTTGDLITATARAPGKSESELSDAVEVKADQSTPPVVNDPIFTGDETITVTNGGDTVNLFIDGELIASKSGPNTVTFNAGTDYEAGDLYRGAEVTASNQNDSSTESERSDAVTVQGVESFLIVYADSDGNILNGGDISTQVANDPFYVRITAKSGENGTGNTFTNFTGNVVFDIQFAVTGDSSPTADFTDGILIHEITAIQGRDDVNLLVRSTDDPLVTGNSNQFSINNPDSELLSLSNLSQNRVRSGSDELTITLTGTGFVLNSIAQFDGTNLETSYISESVLEVTIPESLINTEGDFPIRVFNPEPEGGTSNDLTFQVSDIAIFYSRADGVWGESNSWSEVKLGGTASEFSPDSGSEVIIGNGNTISISGGASVSNNNRITVKENSKLIVADGATLNMGSEGEIVIETGGVAEINGDAAIDSNNPIQVDNEALFCNFGSSTPVLQLNRQMNGPEGWRYITSPVKTDLATLLGSVWTQGGPGARFEDGESNVYRWPLNQPDREDSNDFRPHWMPVEDFRNSEEGGDGDISPGEGFLLYLFESDFDGSNQLPQTLTVTGPEFEPFTQSQMNTESFGWTLLGNPFACSISFEELFGQAVSREITGSVYVWDDSGDGLIGEPELEGVEGTGSGSWKTYAVGGDGDLTGGRIAPFQAFFVQNTENAESGVDFTQNVKSTELPVDFMFKEKERHIIRLEVEGRLTKNSTWIRFSDEGSSEFTHGDAHQLQPMSQNFTYLASQKPDGSLLDIGHFNYPDSETEIPILVETTIPGDYTIKATDFNLSQDTDLVFKDLQENVSVPLDESFYYEFSIQQTDKKLSEPDHILKKPVAAKSNASLRFMITTGSADESNDLPTEFTLEQNYPNPFNPSTTIRYELPESSNVQIRVYDMTGRNVATLVEGNIQSGRHSIQFDASNLASGVYVYRLIANNQVISRKLTIIK